MTADAAYTVGMKRRHVQYTVRDVPIDVDRRLRAAARRSGKSLNRTVLGLLCKEAGVSETALYADLDGFFGSWVHDAEIDRALAEQRTIDPELWK